MDIDGRWQEVTTVSIDEESLRAYNIDVANFDTYFVTDSASAAADLWVHNQGCGGEKRGPKTDPSAPHNKKITEIGDQVELDGGTIVAGGGRRKERLISTPGGNKNGRRPDVLYKDCNGNHCGVNVGKTKADGSPILREQQALDDLNGAGLPTRFERYD